MFEQELAMEKKSSSIIPLLLIVGLIVGIVGVSLYFVVESRRVMSTAEATPIVLALLDQKPATLRFETGNIQADESEKLREPHYRLLEKEGYLKIGKQSASKTPVSLTPQGQALLAEIAGVKQSKNKDGNDTYAVPLGKRKLVEVSKVTMLSGNKAVIEYSWKWEPTKAGDLLDAAGPAVKQFKTWERATLIDKYGAAFYHGEPTKVVVTLAKNYYGWKVTTD